jgi:hypothetical protein
MLDAQAQQAPSSAVATRRAYDAHILRNLSATDREELRATLATFGPSAMLGAQ